MKTLAIIGSGELGQQIAHLATSDRHYGSIVFFDDFAEVGLTDGRNVLGNTDDIENAFTEGQFDDLLIGIGYKHLEMKAKFFERFASKIPMGKVVHSSAWIDPTAVVEPGCVIYPGCIVDKKAVIKSGALLNLGCTISHDSIVGSHSFLSPEVAVAGFVTIGSRCSIGINATIIDNLQIADATRIGAGSVVINTITQSGLYVGNPAKFIRE